jgi:anaerobic selenocysteine-containing dehydrogenase
MPARATLLRPAPLTLRQPSMPKPTVAYRTCPLCEACCGLAVELCEGRVAAIRGDREDVFSAGYLCPKGVALKELHEDPDRLHAPLVKRGGRFAAASWEEAFSPCAAVRTATSSDAARTA